MVMCKASLTKDLDEALSSFNSELNELMKDSNKAQKEYLELANRYISEYPDLEMIGGKGTPIYVKDICEKILAKNTKKHGGKRAGSGRKKKEFSPPVRVPESLHPLVFLLKEIHEGEYKDKESINKLILMLKPIKDVLFDAYMVLDHGDHDERLAMLDALKTLFEHNNTSVKSEK